MRVDVYTRLSTGVTEVEFTGRWFTKLDVKTGECILYLEIAYPEWEGYVYHQAGKSRSEHRSAGTQFVSENHVDVYIVSDIQECDNDKVS